MPGVYRGKGTPQYAAMLVRRRARAAELSAVEVARRRARAKAYQAAARVQNPEKFSLMEARRYRCHEMQRVRRDVSRRPAFGRLGDELRAARLILAAVDGSEMSVWQLMAAAMPRYLKAPKGDDCFGDSAYRWLKQFDVPRGT
jgi:hypothetical protein